jgi:hypothetical protein
VRAQDGVVAAGVGGGVRGGAGPDDGGGGCGRQSHTAARASAMHRRGPHRVSRRNQIDEGVEYWRQWGFVLEKEAERRLQRGSAGDGRRRPGQLVAAESPGGRVRACLRWGSFGREVVVCVQGILCVRTLG